MLNKKTFIFLFAYCLNIQQTASLFAQINSNRENEIAAVKSTFTYASNKDYSGQDISLKADLYKPTLFSIKMPVVIIYHGGGYASGDRNLAVLKVFSDYFTAQNISTILPDFRQGWYESATKPLCESVTSEKFKDAAHRAFQDNRALIRYCKANADLLGIDSNKIFLFGISSGGFLALHHLYMDDNSVAPERLSKLGSLDLQGNDLTNSTDVAGIISVVGGFYTNNTNIVKKYPALLFNNSCDGAVDFYNGWLGNCSNTVRTYGPGIFTKLLEQFNSPYSFHVFCGFNHGFNSVELPLGGDIEAVEYINKKSVAFIRETIQDSHNYALSIASDSIGSKPLGDCKNFETFFWCKKDSIAAGNHLISLTPNPISCLLQPKLNIRHPQDALLNIEIINSSGKLISRQKTEYKTSQNVIYLNVNDFALGVNILVVKDGSGKVLYKTKALRFCEF